MPSTFWGQTQVAVFASSPEPIAVAFSLCTDAVGSPPYTIIPQLHMAYSRLKRLIHYKSLLQYFGGIPVPHDSVKKSSTQNQEADGDWVLIGDCQLALTQSIVYMPAQKHCIDGTRTFLKGCLTCIEVSTDRTDIICGFDPPANCCSFDSWPMYLDPV